MLVILKRRPWITLRASSSSSSPSSSCPQPSLALSTMASSLRSVSLPSLSLSSSQSLGISNRIPCFRAFPAKPLRISCKAASPETVEKVIEIVTKQLACEEAIHPHSKFQDLGADSLDQVEIVMALEEAFGINVDESGAEAIVTIQDAADLCEKSKSEKGSA